MHKLQSSIYFDSVLDLLTVSDILSKGYRNGNNIKQFPLKTNIIENLKCLIHLRLVLAYIHLLRVKTDMSIIWDRTHVRKCL